MDALISEAGQFIQSHQAWAGPIIFLMTFGESMLIIGILLPATVLLMMSGGLVGSGTLPAWPILLWGFAGAVLGDALSYWIGKWLGPRVLRLRLLKTHRNSVARARLLCSRYGFLAVLLGRFLGPLRSLMPTVAGVMGMTEKRFQLANVLSAILWVPALLAPGYLTAISIDAARHSRESLIYSALGCAVLIGIAALIWTTRSAHQHKRRRATPPK
jgi:membrane protein DedA with SNARE-associated domain